MSDTVRSLLERIRDRHFEHPSRVLRGFCAECRRAWPCGDRWDAVAGLFLLDASDPMERGACGHGWPDFGSDVIAANRGAHHGCEPFERGRFLPDSEASS